MSHIANRLGLFQESVIREMTRKSMENDAINLSQGMPDFSPPDELIEGLYEAVKLDEHQYSVTYGRYDLREKISQKLLSYNRIDVDPEREITVTCGASEAIASSILAITNPGDEILILEPWYENYVPITHLANGKPVFVPLSDRNFSLDEEKIKEKINNNTKAIVINTPHNPTGKVFSDAELKIIADLSNDHNLIALTDEIYEYILYENNKHVSISQLDGMENRTVTISGFSKTFSITGWRIGYIAAKEHLMSGIRKVHDYLTVCAPSLLQLAVIKSFDLQQAYFEELKQRYKTNRDLLVEKLGKLGFSMFIPQGAYYLLADISSFGMADKEFADFLVMDKGVATVPGTSFYQKNKLTNEGDKYLRFSFSQKKQTLEDAMERIQSRIEEL